MRDIRVASGLGIAVRLGPALCVLVAVLTFGGGSAQADSLFRVECPVTSQCIAVGGSEAVSFDPTGLRRPSSTTIDGSGDLRGLGCPSVFQCTAVDAAGREVTFDPTVRGKPVAVAIDGSHALLAVACPSVRQCTATDDAGREVTFDPSAPGNPTPVAIDASEVVRIVVELRRRSRTVDDHTVRGSAASLVAAMVGAVRSA